jgi:hypothetical protein
MILAAGTCAEQLAFPGIAPLDNGMDQALSRIYAESICAPAAVPAFLEYVRQEATALLVSQRHVLEALADALEARRTLDTMAIDVVIAAAVCKADKEQEKARREVWNRKLESAAAFRQEVEIVSGI